MGKTITIPKGLITFCPNCKHRYELSQEQLERQESSESPEEDELNIGETNINIQMNTGQFVKKQQDQQRESFHSIGNILKERTKMEDRNTNAIQEYVQKYIENFIKDQNNQYSRQGFLLGVNFIDKQLTN